MQYYKLNGETLRREKAPQGVELVNFSTWLSDNLTTYGAGIFNTTKFTEQERFEIENNNVLPSHQVPVYPEKNPEATPVPVKGEIPVIKPETTLFKCDCGKEFSKERGLKLHITKVHKDAGRETKNNTREEV